MLFARMLPCLFAGLDDERQRQSVRRAGVADDTPRHQVDLTVLSGCLVEIVFLLGDAELQCAQRDSLDQFI